VASGEAGASLTEDRAFTGRGLAEIHADHHPFSARPVVIAQALLDEPTDLFVLDARQGVAVGPKRFVAAAEPAKYVGARKVERHVVFQKPRALDAV
jgi:hypothetical protein